MRRAAARAALRCSSFAAEGACVRSGGECGASAARDAARRVPVLRRGAASAAWQLTAAWCVTGRYAASRRQSNVDCNAPLTTLTGCCRITLARGVHTRVGTPGPDASPPAPPGSSRPLAASQPTFAAPARLFSAAASRACPPRCTARHAARGTSHTLMHAVNAPVPPHQVVPMPSLSPTMSEGALGKWKKAVGDKVNPGDILAEIQTVRATAHPSRAAQLSDSPHASLRVA